MEKKPFAPVIPPVTLPRLSPAAWLTFSYLILSTFWILCSDAIAAKLSHQYHPYLTFENIQVIKGIFFVFLSATLLFLLSKKLYTGIHNSYEQKQTIERKFTVLNEMAREGIIDFNFKEEKAILNDKMKFFFPAIGNTISNFWEVYQTRIHPEDLEKQKNEFNEILCSDKQAWQSEFRLLGTDGKYYSVISNAYIIRDKETCEPVQLIGAVQDISELRRLKSEYYEQRLKHKRTLAASIIKAQEIERNRWAEELHDNVCQILSVANLYTSDICSKPENAKTMAPEVKKLVMESIHEIRQLSANIKTPSFTKETLLESIERLAANINRINSVHFTLTTSRFDESKLCTEQKLMIYRIVQEQFNNIIKYAEASEVEVRLSITGNSKIEIAVNDNGKGFDTTQIKTGIGLRNIQSRLQVYNGDMRIKSTPGYGCSLAASFKLMSA
ncbi:MAG: PAS domain-containing protein [Chitinophagales bacterium]|nr:PAS domain-containing protein [Chitinophagales bacterium]